MSKRKSPPLAGDGGKRARITVSVPSALLNLIPATENRSALVSELLEENAGRWSSISQIEIRALKKKKALEMFQRQILEMSASISASAAASDTKAISTLIFDIDKRIAGLEDIQRQLEGIKDGLVEAKKERYDQVRGYVFSAVKEAVVELDLQGYVQAPETKVQAPAKLTPLTPEQISRVKEEMFKEGGTIQATPVLSDTTIIASPSPISQDILPMEIGKEVTIVPGLKFTRN